MDLKEMRQIYIDDGYEPLDASAKVCQDILLTKRRSGYAQHFKG